MGPLSKMNQMVSHVTGVWQVCASCLVWKTPTIMSFVVFFQSFQQIVSAPTMHYTTSCTQSSLPEDRRNYRPKHVEVIEIINKINILASSWLFTLLYQ